MTSPGPLSERGSKLFCKDLTEKILWDETFAVQEKMDWPDYLGSTNHFTDCKTLARHL